LRCSPLELEGDLLLDRHHAVGQEAVQAEGLALVGAEGEVLGQQPIGEEVGARDSDLGRTAGGDGVVGRGERAHRRRGYALGSPRRPAVRA
jgi:hypothetical protein